MLNDSNQSADAAIIARVIGGNADAFEDLLKKYADPVCRIVKKHVPYDQVQETVQDVFVRAYQSLPTFGHKSSFKQWLSAVAVRTCYDFWRRHYRSRELPISSLAESHQDWLEKVLADQSNQSFQEENRQKEAREILDWALDRMSAEDRMVLELVYLEGLSGKEAAGLLGWSVANVKIRAYRCRRKLHKLLLNKREGR